MEKVWCKDLPDSESGSIKPIRLRVGESEFSIACASGLGKGLTPGRILDGKNPSGSYVYFLYQSDSAGGAWATTELMPNLILLHWQDTRGFILHFFSLSTALPALALAFLLVFSVRYLVANFRTVFSFPSFIRPERAYLIKIAILAAVILVLYWLPWFHNIVLLYFSFLGLALAAFHKMFLGQGPGSPSRSMRSSDWLVLSFLVATAFLMRAHKADWGFPLLLHPDEAAITDFPARMAETNSLNPIDFERPNHASIYANSILYGIASQARFHAPLPQTFPGHQTFYYRLSRLWVALLGSLCVILAFLIGREYHARFGLFAAAVFALYPQFVVHSHYITPDIPQTLLFLCVILFSIRYISAPTPRNLFWACAFAALASAEKYPGLIALSVIALAIANAKAREKGNLLPTLYQAALIYAGVLFLAAPFLFLKPHMVLLNLISESRPTHAGHDGLGLLGNSLYYIRAYGSNTSFLLALLGAVGLAGLIRSYGWKAAPLFLGFVYWIFLSRLPLHWERWTVPMVISPLFCAAYGMHLVWEVRRPVGGAARLGLTLAFLLLCAVPLANLLLRDLVQLSDLEAQDTCLLGLGRLGEMGITEGNSLSGNYTPYSPVWKRGFDFIASYQDEKAIAGKRYAIVSSEVYGRYFREPEKYPNEIAFYRALQSQPLVLDLKPASIPERLPGFSDFRNLGQAGSLLKSYFGKGRNFSTGGEIQVYQVSPR